MDSPRSVDAVDPVGELAERQPTPRESELLALLETRTQAAEAAESRLASLLKYAQHFGECPCSWIRGDHDPYRVIHGVPAVCDCGLAALLVQQGAPETEQK